MTASKRSRQTYGAIQSHQISNDIKSRGAEQSYFDVFAVSDRLVPGEGLGNYLPNNSADIARIGDTIRANTYLQCLFDLERLCIDRDSC